eukprot:6128265-Pleurochrysis_carterae.AAC.1
MLFRKSTSLWAGNDTAKRLGETSVQTFTGSMTQVNVRTFKEVTASHPPTLGSWWKDARKSYNFQRALILLMTTNLTTQFEYFENVRIEKHVAFKAHDTIFANAQICCITRFMLLFYRDRCPRRSIFLAVEIDCETEN